MGIDFGKAGAALLLALPLAAGAAPQGPVADGPYIGTLPCADCAGIRTELTLFTLGGSGRPESYRMRVTYLGTRDGDRTEERLGPWLKVDDRVRVEPYDDAVRQTFRRVDADTLVLLDRMEKPIETKHDLTLRRDRAEKPLPRASAARTLFRGTVTRNGAQLLLAPCGGGQAERVRDASVESTISAVLADLGFDRNGRMYLEAFGRRADGQVMLERLNRAGVEMRCPEGPARSALRAQGNEPAWGLRVAADGVTFSQPDGAVKAPPVPVSWRWPGGRPDRAEAIVTTSAEGSAMRAVLTSKICRDTMATAAFGFTATVARQRPAPATEFRGCGFLDTATLP